MCFKKCTSDFSPFRLTISIMSFKICLHIKYTNMYVFSLTETVDHDFHEHGLPEVLAPGIRALPLASYVT